MPREKSPNRERALQIFLENSGSVANREIAEMIGEKEKTISAWKVRDKWNVVLQSENCSTTNENSGPSPPHKGTADAEVTRKSRIPKQPPTRGGAPAANKNAVTHGLYRKYLPASMQQMIEDIRGIPLLDVLYENILFDFAKIIEALRLMHVYDRDDHLKLIKKKRWDVGGKEGNGDDNGREQGIINEIEYEIHVAPELQAGAMKALATVQAALRANIKLFMELSGLDDKRRLEIESMQASLDKTRAEIDKLKGGGDDVATVVFVEDLDD